MTDISDVYFDVVVMCEADSHPNPNPKFGELFFITHFIKTYKVGSLSVPIVVVG